MVYRMIQRLQERGLIETEAINGKQQLYRPLSLQSLIKALEKDQRRLRRLELKLRDLDSLLPFMENPEELDVDDELIQIHEGREALCAEYLRIPDQPEDEFLAVGSSEGFWNAAGISMESSVERSFVRKRLDKNIYSRIMMMDCQDAERIQDNDTREKRTTKLCRSLPFQRDCLMLCGDRLSHFLCDPENPRVITIQSPELVHFQRLSFEDLWKEN